GRVGKDGARAHSPHARSTPGATDLLDANAVVSQASDVPPHLPASPLAGRDDVDVSGPLPADAVALPLQLGTEAEDRLPQVVPHGRSPPHPLWPACRCAATCPAG